jgi:hypothetical protein
MVEGAKDIAVTKPWQIWPSCWWYGCVVNVPKYTALFQSPLMRLCGSNGLSKQCGVVYCIVLFDRQWRKW